MARAGSRLIQTALPTFMFSYDYYAALCREGNADTARHKIPSALSSNHKVIWAMRAYFIYDQAAAALNISHAYVPRMGIAIEHKALSVMG